MDINIISLYEEVHELLEVRCKQDDQSDPYKSKYNARSILEIMKGVISNDLDKEAFTSESELSLLQARLACVYLLLGIIGIETEELSTGQEHLEKVLEHLKKKEVLSNSITIVLVCLNNLAILWAQRDNQEKAFTYLNKAENFYTQYKNGNFDKPKSVSEIFDCETNSTAGWDGLEKNYTLTQYYLAQVLGKLGKPRESSFLLLTTLQRQLSDGDYEPITWAVNAANLAKFFQMSKKFKLSRRVLAAAWTVIQSPTSEPTEADGTSTLDELKDKWKESKTEIGRIWGLYCLNLLELSQTIFEDPDSTELEDLETRYEEEEESLRQMQFCDLEISAVEEDVTYEVAKDYEEAKKLFMIGLRWLNDARSFFSLEDYASTHTEISQEISTLYKLLASFDSSPDRRSKMHKRRIDMLSSLLEELNSQYYLQVCRQLDYELGETYSALMDCKYDALANAKPSLHQATKINSLAKSSIKHFENYLNSFTNQSGEKVDKFPTDSERPVLVAYFHIGRMWSKLVESSPREKFEFISKSLDNYKILVNYCDKHPSAAPLMSLELPVCQEMVELLPYKMNRIRAHM